ncbi:extracellular solute-binding protein [Bacillus sp. Marseille-P3661]|uniref:extracellular solute-binding protein n=1 Tax=Bacillus sp. Marseille-P3661 TaxID=1936234 RepID=UPI000C841DAC|nr:extracellular solute-binding protein [Bacillus sp. Marseille-P3661]
MNCHLSSIGLTLFSIITIAGCSNTDTVSTKGETEHLVPIKVIAESPEAISYFQMKEEEIKEKYGIELVYNYPQRITDRLEDYLFSTNEKYNIFVTFPVKIPMYVERMLLPLDSYIVSEPQFDQNFIPIYRKLYMNYKGHDYGMVYDGDARLLFYRKDLFKQYNDDYKKR